MASRHEHRHPNESLPGPVAVAGMRALQGIQGQCWRGAQVLEEFGVETEVTVVSAHRTPDRMLEYARSAHTRGIQVQPASPPERIA